MYHHVHAHKILSSENFCKKNSGCFKMSTIYYSFAQLWATFATKLMKRSTIFLYILKLRLCVYKFTKFHDQQNWKKKKKKNVACNLKNILERNGKKLHEHQNLKKKKKKKNVACSLNNIFDRNGQKSFDFCDVFFKFVSLFTLSRRFIMTAFLQELQLFQWC